MQRLLTRAKAMQGVGMVLIAAFTARRMTEAMEMEMMMAVTTGFSAAIPMMLL